MRINIMLKYDLNSSSMRPAPVPFIVHPRNTSANLEFYVTDLGNEKEAMDLTNYEVFFYILPVKYMTDDDTPLVAKARGEGITVDLDNLGYVDIELTAEDLDIAATDYWYKFRVESETGEIIGQPLGQFRLLP